MRFSIIYKALFFLILISFSALASSDPRGELDRLKQEIDSLQTVLDAQRSSEKNFLDQVNSLDRQIAARKRLLHNLNIQLSNERKEVQRLDKKIKATRVKLVRAKKNLNNTSQEVVELEDLIARRARYLYKKGTNDQLRFLLAASNPNDLFRRRIYINKIQQRDKKNLESLRNVRQRHKDETIVLDNTIAELNNAQQERIKSAEKVEVLVADAQKERDKLAANRSEIASLLDKVRNDQQLLTSLIKEREEAATEVENLITSLERDRLSGKVQEIRIVSPGATVRVQEVQSWPQFASGKGKLPWPVRGKVVKKFGLEVNKQLGTKTENPGIDIAANEGTEVIAVQGGQCTRITYIRGFGTTMLIEHDDGFYTVYAHLGEIWVSEGEEVVAGRVLGTVGENMHSVDSSLHFQVWHKREKKDPLKWLG